MTSTLASPPAGSPARAPSMRREFIGPDRAQELLTRNVSNRKIVAPHLADIAKAMEAGEFYEICDPIRLSWDNQLLDGQHRLEAIKKTGVTIPLWIVEGLDPATQDMMDRGRRRTVGDVLTIHGYREGNMLAAAARWVLAIQQGQLIAKNERTISYRATSREILRALEDHPGLLESVPIGRRAKDAPFRYPPSAAAALHYLMASKAGSEAAGEFFEDVFIGEDLKAGDPVWVLRNQLMRSSTGKRSQTTLGVVYWTVLAWNAWRENRTLKVLKYYPGQLLDVSD